MRLIGLGVDDHNDPAPVLWVNPERIAMVRPAITDDGTTLRLHVDIKVDGIPLERILLGRFSTRDEAQVGWDEFLRLLEVDERVSVS